MPDRRPPDAVEPPDPFEGLVLDEEFIRSATVSEPSARTRMLTERWRREPPVDPGGRRWSADGPARTRRARRTRSGRPEQPARFGHRFRALSRGERWTAVLGALIVLLVVGGLLFGPNRAHTPQLASSGARAASPRPTGDQALPDGGTFAGSKCGQHGYHRFPAAADALPTEKSTGPWLRFTSYGYQRLDATRPGEFVFDLELGSGSATPLAISAPLGSAGIAVEIEGPNGVVAAAYGLPTTVNGATHTPDGRGWLITDSGTTAHVVLPTAALCPGIDATAVATGLSPRVDSSQSITGPAPYTLTVSAADPEIAELRRPLGTQPGGEVLAATNQLPQPVAKPV
ncbi:SCO2583/SCO2584 N-terminal domain-containing protein [Kitasatospora cineracea]